MSPSIQRIRGLGRRAAGLVTVDTHMVEMADGVRLATDVHRPSDAGAHPTILVRTPYGRNGLTGIPMVAQAKLLAAAGYVVVLQDVRGRFGSGGTFVPMVNEAADGRRTAGWVHDQPWCDGRLGAWGLSYLGGTAWSVATEVPEMIDALAVGVTHTALALPDPRGVRHIDTTLRWVRSLELMTDTDQPAWTRLRGMLDARRADEAMLQGMHALPVASLDRGVLGGPSPIWQVWADHPDMALPFWLTADRRDRRHLVPPTAHTTGWWDLFVDDHLADHAAQQADGPTDLVVGPWGHLDPRVQTAAFRQARRHFDVHLRDLDGPDPAARVWLSGAERWWRMPGWPPPMTPTEWLLAGGRLVEDEAITAGSVRWVYDPDDPTPSVGGRTLSFEAGRADCAALERRDDVVVHTSAPLRAALTIAGTPVLEGVLSVDTGMGDLAVRITDVDGSGRSVSVTDGYVRVHGARDGQPIRVELHPIAHRFAEGHRVRVLIAGGAFPAFDRNLGFGDDSIHRTQTRPSTMVLERGAFLRLPVHR